MYMECRGPITPLSLLPKSARCFTISKEKEHKVRTEKKKQYKRKEIARRYEKKRRERENEKKHA